MEIFHSYVSFLEDTLSTLSTRRTNICQAKKASMWKVAHGSLSLGTHTRLKCSPQKSHQVARVQAKRPQLPEHVLSCCQLANISRGSYLTRRYRSLEQLNVYKTSSSSNPAASPTLHIPQSSGFAKLCEDLNILQSHHALQPVQRIQRALQRWSLVVSTLDPGPTSALDSDVEVLLDTASCEAVDLLDSLVANVCTG